MPAAIIGSMTCSRMKASERPVLKMTGTPAVGKGHQIGDDAGLHIAGDGTGHRAVDVQEEGKGRGRRRVGAEGGSGGIRGRSSHGSILSAAAPAAPQGDASAPHVTHGYCLATTSIRDPIHIP